MVTEDQSEVVAFLESPAAHAGARVERIDTHASIVFLSGDRALKLKRAVRYDYLDFSTADRRRAMCDAELRVNRRTAPSLYHRVVAVTREPDGSLALGGAGTPVDWVLEMARFGQDGLLDRLAERGELTFDVMKALAAGIARFHQAAERCDGYGGRDGIRRVIEGNAAGFAQEAGGLLDGDSCRRVTALSLELLDRHAATLEDRRLGGFVRHCHGDLHLRNIVLLEGVPTLFDAIEFNDDISCVDVLYDLSFLLMDLWHRRLPGHANAVWNGYLTDSDWWDGLQLLPLFLSCRAAIRAKTSATAAALASDEAARRSQREAASGYLALAESLLRVPPACVLAVGGLSGSGKSTTAHAVAPSVGPAPGAVVLRSDEVRKQLCGVAPLTRLDAAAYTSDVSRRVYDALAARCAGVIGQGHAVVVDAVFGDEKERRHIEAVAVSAGVPFLGVWLEAPAQVLLSRVAERRNDPSDADAGVIRNQLSRDVGTLQWHRVDASAGPADVARAVARLVPVGS
jgi:aminoglycoside phosphotransferase family enzyme/predicted kinase